MTIFVLSIPDVKLWMTIFMFHNCLLVTTICDPIQQPKLYVELEVSVTGSHTSERGRSRRLEECGLIANLLRKRASSRAHRRLDSWWPSPPHWRQCFPGQSIREPQYKYLFRPWSSPISKFPCRPEMTPHRCNRRNQNPKLIKSMPTNRSTKNDFEADLQADWDFMALWHAIAMGQQLLFFFFFSALRGYVHMVLQRLIRICSSSSSLFGFRVSVKLLWELKVRIFMMAVDVICKTSMFPHSVYYLNDNDNNEHNTSICG